MAIQILAWSTSSFAATFFFVFLFELLDNTQLIQVYYSSKYGRQWLLAMAAWSAFACTGAIGASFSWVRALSETVTQGVELFFALLLVVIGVVCLSRSEILVKYWEKMTHFLQTKIADPFLYSMRGVPDEDEDETPKDEVPLNEATVNVSDAAKDHEGSAKEVSATGDIESASPVPKLSQRSQIVWWKLFLLVFATCFVLELPDKTMLMIASLASTSDYPLSIFFGYAGGMICQSLIALIVGRGIGKAAKKYGEYIELVVGVVLTLTGVVKIAIMVFVGDFTIDSWLNFHGDAAASSAL